jgi:hypothetical protein
MDRKLFASIKAGNKASKGKRILEATTMGRSATAVGIAKDWLEALKKLVANEADALEVTADFTNRIGKAVEGGDLSDIYAQIKQQMPDLTDLGLVAANMQSIEQWLKQDGNRINESKTADEGIIGAGLGLVKDTAKAAVNTANNVLDTGVNAVKDTVQTGKNAVARARAEENAMGRNASLTTATTSPSKINSSTDAQDIIKTSVDYTKKDTLDVTNSNPGTVADDVVEGYFVDKKSVAFYVYENGDAYYVNREGEPMREGFMGNVHKVVIEGAPLKAVHEAGVIINIYNDGSGVEMGGDIGGELPPDMGELPPEMPMEEPPVEGPGMIVGGLPPDLGGAEIPPPQVAGADPAADAAGVPPMGPEMAPDAGAAIDHVEMINDGTTGKVNRVIVRAGGNVIEIGPDGEPIVTPDDGGMGGPSVPPMMESMPLVARLRTLFEGGPVDPQAKTTFGGPLPTKGVPNVSGQDALSPLNSPEGKIIDGAAAVGSPSKGRMVKEAGELFEDAEGYAVYIDESGTLQYATQAQVDAANEAAGDYNDITIRHGLGHSLRAPKGRMSTDQFEAGIDMEGAAAEDEVPVPELDTSEANMVDSGSVSTSTKRIGSDAKQFGASAGDADAAYANQRQNFKGQNQFAKDRPSKLYEGQIINKSAFNRCINTVQESCLSIEDIDMEHGVQPNPN